MPPISRQRSTIFTITYNMKRLSFISINCNWYGTKHNKTDNTRGGCFWCIEAAFEDAKGIESVVSGFAEKIKTPLEK